MDWSTRINSALDYIEANLEYDIDLAQAARLALCSPTRFADLFLTTTGTQVNEYIRRRRLSLAAVELLSGNDKVIDVAIKYGYASPTAFNRAFQKQHKVSPQYARVRKVPLLTYPRISLQIILKGDIQVKVRIEEKSAFTVVGVKKQFASDGSMGAVTEFWVETKDTLAQINALNNTEPEGIIGMCADFDGIKYFDYYIAAATTGVLPETHLAKGCIVIPYLPQHGSSSTKTGKSSGTCIPDFSKSGCRHRVIDVLTMLFLILKSIPLRYQKLIVLESFGFLSSRNHSTE